MTPRDDDAYDPVAEEATGEPYVESRDGDVVRPGAAAFASPGAPPVDGGPDQSGDNAEPVPTDD